MKLKFWANPVCKKSILMYMMPLIANSGLDVIESGTNEGTVI